MTKGELASLINSFVNGTCDEWDWDDFTSVRQKDPDIEQIRKRINLIPKEFPSNVSTSWCNQGGIKVLLDIVERISKAP
jgi:hypothetical protein